MNILFLIDSLWKAGGTEMSLFFLVKGLELRGHRAIVCCLKGQDLVETLRKGGLQVENIMIKRIYDLDGLRRCIKLLKLLRQEEISIIVSFHKASDYLGLLLSILSRIPIVSSRRDLGFELKRRHRWFYRLINRFYDHIVTVSQAVRQYVIKTQFADASNISVIHNGVFPAIENIKPTGVSGKLKDIRIDNGYPKVCCLANIRPIKGHEYLIDAVSLVVKEFPNVGVYCVGSWDNDPTTYYKLQEQARNLKLENVVRFMGGIHFTETAALWASMDIMVCPSLSEGMSNALLEAMAAGKPVVATCVGGNPELVRDGEHGYIVPPGNPGALAEALLKLLKNPELGPEMGSRGSCRVKSKFSVDGMVERYEDLLQYIVLKRRLGRWKVLRSWLLERLKCLRGWTKLFVVSAIYHSGLLACVQLSKRALQLGKVKILCFHDISERAELQRNFSIILHPEHFSQFSHFLLQNYQIVSLQEAISLLENGHRLSQDVLAVTFDDCYKGWISHVLPLCQRLQIPFAGFVATQPLDSGPLLYDALMFLAHHTWRRALDLSRWGLGVFLLDGHKNIRCFVEETHAAWRGKSKQDRNQFLQELSEYLEVSLDSQEFRNTLLDWNDVRKMDMSGVTIGAHSVSHGCFSDLSGAECSWEIYESKRRLEEELGHSIEFFAYPYGLFRSDDCNIVDIVKKSGFRNAFTLDIGHTNGGLPFKIPRRSVSQGMFLDPHGRLSEPLLAIELCGLGDIVFGRIFTNRKLSKAVTYK